MNAITKLLALFIASFALTAFASDASFDNYSCETTDLTNLMGPANGHPHAVYFTLEDIHSSLPLSPYFEVVLCRRACGEGAYVFIHDANGLNFPAKEVISETTDANGYIQVVLNTTVTNGVFDASIKTGDKQFVLTNSPFEKLWAYEKTPYSTSTGTPPELINTMAIILGTWRDSCTVTPAPTEPCPIPCGQCGCGTTCGTP